MSERRWRIRLSAPAERDFVAILQWTRERFGVRQAQVYRDLLVEAITSLGQGPAVPGSSARDEILPGLRTLHVGRPGRHFIVYRAGAADDTIEIVRILHDAMELGRNIPPEDPDSETSPTA